MLKLRKIAVTGSVASGKSTVCHLLEELGCFVVDSDEIVHKLLVPESKIGKKVIALLGQEVVVDGKFERGRIADKVFDNLSLLYQLEELIHPEVQKVIEKKYLEIKKTKKEYPLFVAEVPLLFESHLESFYDFVLVVSAPLSQCQERFFKKRGFSIEEWKMRESRLMPISEKIKRAHFLVENSGSQSQLKEQVKELFNQITST